MSVESCSAFEYKGSRNCIIHSGTVMSENIRVDNDYTLYVRIECDSSDSEIHEDSSLFSSETGSLISPLSYKWLFMFKYLICLRTWDYTAWFCNATRIQYKCSEGRSFPSGETNQTSFCQGGTWSNVPPAAGCSGFICWKSYFLLSLAR